MKGKLYVEGVYPWIEKVPINEYQFFVANPPMPAILAIPLVAIFGKEFPQQYLAHALGAILVGTVYLLARKMGVNKIKSIWVSSLTGFGTIIWFLSANGSVWYLGQTTAALFLTLALLSASKKTSPLWTGIFLGAAYLSRIQAILAFPLLVYLLNQKKSYKNTALMTLGVVPFVLFNFYYNFARSGVIWDKAYTLIPGVTTEPWYSQGIIHPSYILGHLKIMLWSFPIFEKEAPFIIPSWGGLAIWITTPAFIYILNAPLKDKPVIFSWISLLLIAAVVFMHGSTGFAQFGYRFAVDFYPLLIFIITKAISKTGLRWHHWVLLAISIGINLWGVIWINKFDWVKF